MTTTLHRAPKITAIATLVVATGLLVGIALLSAAGELPEPETILACVKQNGQIRLLAPVPEGGADPGEGCEPGQILIEWNVVGPAGPQGPQGATGGPRTHRAARRDRSSGSAGSDGYTRGHRPARPDGRHRHLRHHRPARANVAVGDSGDPRRAGTPRHLDGSDGHPGQARRPGGRSHLYRPSSGTLPKRA